ELLRLRHVPDRARVEARRADHRLRQLRVIAAWRTLTVGKRRARAAASLCPSPEQHRPTRANSCRLRASEPACDTAVMRAGTGAVVGEAIGAVAAERCRARRRGT